MKLTTKLFIASMILAFATGILVQPLDFFSIQNLGVLCAAGSGYLLGIKHRINYVAEKE